MKQFMKDTFSRDFAIGATRCVTFVVILSATGAACRAVFRR